jgi:hypothetical protein
MLASLVIGGISKEQKYECIKSNIGIISSFQHSIKVFYLEAVCFFRHSVVEIYMRSYPVMCVY